MFKKIGMNRAQTTLEYAILIGVIVAGLIAMQIYIKRGFQGKLKESADSMGQQFSPGLSTANFTINSSTTSQERLENTGVSTTNIISQETNRTGSENVENLNQEVLFPNR